MKKIAQYLLVFFLTGSSLFVPHAQAATDPAITFYGTDLGSALVNKEFEAAIYYTTNLAAGAVINITVTGLPQGMCLYGGTTCNTENNIYSTVGAVAFTGTPTQLGSYSVNISINQVNCSGVCASVSQTFVMQVLSTPSFSAPNDPFVTNIIAGRKTYSEIFFYYNGLDTPTYNITGTLPPGLTASTLSYEAHYGFIDITGTPTTTGHYNFTLNLSSPSAASVTSKNYFFDVSADTTPPKQLSLVTHALPDGAVGVKYDATVTLTGFDPNILATVTFTGLPSGIRTLSTAHPTSAQNIPPKSNGDLDIYLTGVPDYTGYFSIDVSAISGTKSFLGTVYLSVSPGSTNSNNATVSVGKNVNAGGTVYYIDGSTKKAYTSAGAFLSYGFNSWSTVTQATSADVALPSATYTPSGANQTQPYYIPPRNGTLINDNGTVYIITNGMRAGFSSESVFRGLDFSFDKVTPGDTSFMTSLAPINSSSQAHPNSTVVRESNGTISIIKDGYRLGVPGMDIFHSWGLKDGEWVPANSYDIALPVTAQLQTRMSNQFGI